MSTDRTFENQTEFAVRVAASTGHQHANEIALALMALLDKIEGYIENHGEGCACVFCSQPDSDGSRSGVAVADTLSGSVALLTMLAGAIDSHVQLVREL